MKTSTIAISLCLAICGCHSEPKTLREEAEQAQDNLKAARERAAEVIVESEEEAVDMVADARQEAQQGTQDAKRDADNIIADAKEKLVEKLDQLSETTVDSNPAVEADAKSP